MEPVYKYMQSYPNQKDQIYYGPPYYPGMGAAPTQMHVNPVRPPMGYGYWSGGSNYGAASPMGCHGCCSHSYLPAHCAWGPPYSHVAPHHCPGNYPSFPVQYMPPPPYYAMEQPRYEYEKNMPREHHCCGCSNQPLHHKEQRNVRIEEEEPERERRKDDSVIPFQSKNLPYPIVWLPPDCIGNKERTANHVGDAEDGSRDMKVHEKNRPYPIVWLPPDYNTEQGKVKSTEEAKDGLRNVMAHENGNRKATENLPAFWNGRLPSDLNTLFSTKNREDGQEKQQDGDNRNFPFPLFWMPYKPEEKDMEGHKVTDDSTKPSLESEKGSGVNGENIGERAASKVRDIPVKEGGRQVEMEAPVKQQREKDASVNRRSDNEKKVDNGEKVSPKEGPKGKSPSPAKSSKLPPICLRVDPLPRRKNGNGSSRSPSPPKNKQQPNNSQSNDARNVHNSSENKEQKIVHNEFKEHKGTKNIEVIDGRTMEGKTMDVKGGTPVKLRAESQDEISKEQADEKPKEEHSTQKHTGSDAVVKGQPEDARAAGGENIGSLEAQEIIEDKINKSCKRELSEEEAAAIIQSAYRGFDVRRWEPVKKLKQVAKVREQIADVKHLIQAMQSPSDTQSRNKQKTIIAETIMSLMLKLDTIQGLHPSIREVRKSVVRELVSLQEQLDSAANEEPEHSPGEKSTMTRDEDALNKSEAQEATLTGLLEAHQNQIDGEINRENSEISEANPIGEEASERIEKEAAVSSKNDVVDSAPEAAVEDEKSKEVGNESIQTDLQENQNLIDGGSSHDNSLSSEADYILEESSQKIEKEVPESSANKVVEPAPEPEPTIEKFEKGNEVLESDGTLSEEVRNDLVLGQGSEVSSLQHDSSAKVIDIAATYNDMLGIELFELPVGVLDECYAQEGAADVAIKPDASRADQVKQLEEALVHTPIISEPHETSDDEDSNRTFETHEVLDVALNGVDVEVETTNCCNADDKLGSEEEVDSKTGGARIEQLQNLIEVNDEARDIRVEGAAEAISEYNEKNSDDCITQENVITEINFSGEVTEQMQPQITEEPADLPQQGEESNNSGEVFEEKRPQIVEDSQPHVEESLDVPPQGEECNTQLRKVLEEKGLKDVSAHEENTVVPTSRVEVTESNQKLIEDNERLREMVEKLIKSGQEQSATISSVSGRIKDLEKKLARKKKLKVKQRRAPRWAAMHE